MSEPPPEREWRFYLDDMIAFTEKVLTYTDGLNQAAFESNPKTFDATLRNLELIGEAATRIPQSVRDGASEIPWRQVIATRNRLIHGCLGVDNDTIWSVIQDDVPELLVNLRRLRATRDESE
ncbi:MAG: DUF86 domain-containing protein [Gammaproteobacteria bacterium]|nr:MAG: DUF86 domain-containing protein [Gammaproteobacteria bacterium]